MKTPKAEAEPNPVAEMIVLIDGAHIHAAQGYQTRYIDLTVGKIEVPGRPPRRFALAAGVRIRRWPEYDRP